MAQADLEFRATQQFAATRREFDLNDPEALKKATLTRQGDEDPRLGPSSLQVFQGEDLAAKERKRLQAEQQRQWLQQQRVAEAEAKAAEGAYSCVCVCVCVSVSVSVSVSIILHLFPWLIPDQNMNDSAQSCFSCSRRCTCVT